MLSKKGEGTFSEVLKVEAVSSGHQYAVKCMKSLYPSIKQVNELREIQALRRLNPHPHIIGMEEILYDPETGRLAIVLELMQQNVYELIRHRKDPLDKQTIQSLMFQLLTAVCHMHDHGVFHRDIKPENVLVLGQAQLKVADLGSCRGLFSAPPFTEYISTRWYRAPECLLTSGYYDYKMDIWGVGCVFFEIVALQPLFPGSNELDQIDKIHHVMGTPSKQLLQAMQGRGGGGGGGAGGAQGVKFAERRGVGFAHLLPKAVACDAMLDLIEQLLIYNPEKRITARQALQHRYFDDIREKDRQRRERDKDKADRTDKAEQLHRAALAPAAAAAAAAGVDKPKEERKEAAVAVSAAASAVKAKAAAEAEEEYEPDDDHTDGEYEEVAAHSQQLVAADGTGLGGAETVKAEAAKDGRSEGKRKKRKAKTKESKPEPPLLSSAVSGAPFASTLPLPIHPHQPHPPLAPPPPHQQERKGEVVPLPALAPQHVLSLSPKAKTQPLSTVLSTSPTRLHDAAASMAAAPPPSLLQQPQQLHGHHHPSHPPAAVAAAASPLLVPLSMAAELHTSAAHSQARLAASQSHHSAFASHPTVSAIASSLSSSATPSSLPSSFLSDRRRRKKKKEALRSGPHAQLAVTLPSEMKTAAHSFGLSGAASMPPLLISSSSSSSASSFHPPVYHHAYSLVQQDTGGMPTALRAGLSRAKGAAAAGMKPSPFLSKLTAASGASVKTSKWQ